MVYVLICISLVAMAIHSYITQQSVMKDHKKQKAWFEQIETAGYIYDEKSNKWYKIDGNYQKIYTPTPSSPKGE